MGKLYAETAKNLLGILDHKVDPLELFYGSDLAADAFRESSCCGFKRGSPRFGSYTFTDISPWFLERAMDRFEDYADRIQFAKLNIELDPAQQGFKQGEYGLVIAANVSRV